MNKLHELITKQNNRTNNNRLEDFKIYVEDPFNIKSFKTYLMFEKTCKLLQMNYIDQNNKQFLFDLKQHIMLFKDLSIINTLTIDQKNTIREKFEYYKYFIISEQEINRY